MSSLTSRREAEYRGYKIKMERRDPAGPSAYRQPALIFQSCLATRFERLRSLQERLWPKRSSALILQAQNE
jgi:hypothetical protein